MQLRLSKTKILGLVIFSLFLGYAAQQLYISDANTTLTGYNQIGFTILVPIFVVLFIGFLYLIKIKSKLLVTILSILLFGFIFLLNFALYPILGGGISEMYVLMAIWGLPPSLLIGLFYGLYIAYNLDKETSKLQKLIVYSIITLVVSFFTFLIAESSTCSFNQDYICLSHKAVENNNINICYKTKSDFNIDSCLFHTYTNNRFSDKSCDKIKSEWKFNDCVKEIVVQSKNRELCNKIKPIETPAWAPVKNQQDCFNYLDSATR